MTETEEPTAPETGADHGARSTRAREYLGLRIPLLVSSIAALLDLFLWVPGVGLFVCAVLAGCGFLLALYFHRGGDDRASVTFCGACVYGIVALIIFGGVRYQVEQEKLAAAVLIVAVESYHDRRGEWPADLTALVPKYMVAIPPVSLRPGHRFELVHDAPDILLRWSGTLPGSAYAYEFTLDQTREREPFAGGISDFLRPPWRDAALPD